MKGEIEEIFLILRRIKGDINKNVVKEILIHRGRFNSFGGSQLDIARQIRDSVNNFNAMVNEAVIEITEELSGKKKEALLNDEWFRETQLATILNVSRGTITFWKGKHYFPNHRDDGKHILIPKTDVDALIKFKGKYRENWERFCKSKSL